MTDRPLHLVGRDDALDVDYFLDRTLGPLDADSRNCDVNEALRRFAAEAVTLDPLDKALVRRGAIAGLDRLGVKGAAALVGAALALHTTNGTTREPAAATEDPEPSTESQEGAALLADIAGWVRRYVYLPDGSAAADAVAAWALVTWCAAHVYFAPLLILASPTKAAGKTTLLDLLRYVVHRGHLTSAYGATGAVIFRLNEAQHPTFLLDEAERLSGRDADRDVVNLLNQGHRRGGYVDRCRENKDGGFDVERFDAFGFRALALIGKPWDTLLDRGLAIRLERKPRDAKLDRFAARTVAVEGRALASRLARWAADQAEAVGVAEQHVPRPTWLRDRGCDNWAPLFAVATVAGGDWPAKLETAAKVLQGAVEDDGDRGERLLQDLAHLFVSQASPAAIPTGDVLEALNALEESSWADERGGKGLSPQRLAALLRPFKIRPRQARDGERVIRGYWWADLAPVTARYTPVPIYPFPQCGTGGGSTPQNPNDSGACTSVPLVPLSRGGYTGTEGGTALDLEAVARARLDGRERTADVLNMLVENPPDGTDPGAWWAALDRVTAERVA
jgi:hypothetical protein